MSTDGVDRSGREGVSDESLRHLGRIPFTLGSYAVGDLYRAIGWCTFEPCCSHNGTRSHDEQM